MDDLVLHSFDLAKSNSTTCSPPLRTLQNVLLIAIMLFTSLLRKNNKTSTVLLSSLQGVALRRWSRFMSCDYNSLLHLFFLLFCFVADYKFARSTSPFIVLECVDAALL